MTTSRTALLLVTLTSATAFAANSGYAASTPLVGTLDGGLTQFNTLANPFPDGILRPTGNGLGSSTFLGQAPAVWDSRQRMPETYQWNVDVQRELPGRILLDVAYAGSRGVHLAFRNRQMNELDDLYNSPTGEHMTQEDIDRQGDLIISKMMA